MCFLAIHQCNAEVLAHGSQHYGEDKETICLAVRATYTEYDVGYVPVVTFCNVRGYD